VRVTKHRPRAVVLLCSVQSGVSQHQSATDDAATSSNMSVRSAAAAAAAAAAADASDLVHPDTSASDVQRTRRVNSGSSTDIARLRVVIFASASYAAVLLARQFAARQM